MESVKVGSRSLGISKENLEDIPCCVTAVAACSSSPASPNCTSTKSSITSTFLFLEVACTKVLVLVLFVADVPARDLPDLVLAAIVDWKIADEIK